jgi:phytoene dehydrogenase-like protein
VPGFGAAVRSRALLTPEDLEERFGLTEGTATQGELTLDQILFMRPVPSASRSATPIPGLYLAGVGCHPGPGIAGVSGWLAARRLLGSA